MKKFVKGAGAGYIADKSFRKHIMSQHPLLGETLVTLSEAADDFGGVKIPKSTVVNYTYQGVKGIKLESIYINGRYTSKEAILRFIERRQGYDPAKSSPRRSKETETTLKQFGVIK
jgi:hypothetical protein